LSQSGRRLTSAFRSEALPVKRVIPYLGRIVENGDLVGFSSGGDNDLFKRRIRKLGTCDQVVGVVHVATVVLAVMKTDGFGGDDRLKSIFGVGQRR